MIEDHEPERNGRLRAVALGALSLVLAWLVVERSLVAYLAEVAPQAALFLAPNDARALANLADRVYTRRWVDQQRGKPAPQAGANTAADQAGASDGNARLGAWSGLALKAAEKNVPGEDPAEIAGLSDAEITEKVRRWAEAAVANDPFNARALRVLGQLAADANDKERAALFMRAAADRSHHESLAVYWLLHYNIERNDFAAAIGNADVLLRTRPEIAGAVVAALGQIAEKGGAEDLKAILAGNPPWRAQFFNAMMNGISDARTPLDLLLSLRNTDNPPTFAELKPYIDFLVGHRLYELAHYTWLQFLPLEQLSSTGFLFNSSFELPPSGLSFDWVMRPGAGANAEITTHPDRSDARALLVQFGLGRVEFPGVTQLLMLPPGKYEISGKHKGQISGRRGLKWKVRCAGKQAVLAESDMMLGAVPEWDVFRFSLTVPDSDCPAQYLRLELDARMASEQIVSGEMWFDDLRLVRLIGEEG
jgi:hypothetical protein